MRNKLKIFISLIISIIMVLQTACPVFAVTSSMSNPDTYAECLSDDISDNTETFEEIAELKEELKALDELAKYYYDYYNEHGTYPSEEDLPSTYISVSKVVSLLSSAGIKTTVGKIAELAAGIGTLGSLDGPIPILDLLALLLGLYFTSASDYDYSFSEIKRLYNKTEEIQNLASDAVTSKKSTVRTNVAKAFAAAYAVALSKKNNNAEYFKCRRNEGIGGGVIIKEEISFNEALEEVLGKEDVYCINKGVAKRLANAAAKATPGGVAKEDRAHTSSSQPLNLPHYHIEVNGTHNENGSHIFFPL